jgi:hypothetical protein
MEQQVPLTANVALVVASVAAIMAHRNEKFGTAPLTAEVPQPTLTAPSAQQASGNPPSASSR